jgi:hypothetical protein
MVEKGWINGVDSERKALREWASATTQMIDTRRFLTMLE